MFIGFLIFWLDFCIYKDRNNLCQTATLEKSEKKLC